MQDPSSSSEMGRVLTRQLRRGSEGCHMCSGSATWEVLWAQFPHWGSSRGVDDLVVKTLGQWKSHAYLESHASSWLIFSHLVLTICMVCCMLFYH